MPGLSSSAPAAPQNTAFRFANALVKTGDTEAAARDLADAIQTQLGGTPLDLACVFFSAHHAARAEVLASMLTEQLCPRLLIGCSGEGVI
ncbi:MAG: hypothetical protein ABL983_21860, partial [Nitrospira sp.]